MKLNNAVLVIHPGLQHAHQLAWALHECGWLQEFWSGVPVTDDGSDIPFWLPENYRQRIKTVPIPKELRRHPISVQLVSRLGDLLPMSPAAKLDYGHRVMHAFDWWMARKIQRLRPKVVVAYENSAYHIFRAARRIGAICILDAPSLHHVAGNSLMGNADTPYTAEINKRKDQEIEQADLILTCSPLAARSYIDNQIPERKVVSLLLGAQLPTDFGTSHIRDNSLPPQFIFAGVLSRRKSVDLIVEALRRLHAEGIHCACHFVGGVENPVLQAEVESTPNAVYHRGVPQSELYSILSKADALILPSRFDSFGMVVAEAMACGTPAIVSTQTGAKAIIERFPGSGWIVEPTLDNIYQKLRELSLNVHQLIRARQFAILASKEFTWASYRQRASQLIEERLSCP